MRAGLVPNKAFLIMMGSPHQVTLTPNSDTAYAGALVDLSAGPMVVELPPGALICVLNDLNQRYVMDMGLPRRVLHWNRHHVPHTLCSARSRLAGMCRPALST